MTVEKLINKLNKLPKDAEVIIENDELYITGYYKVTNVNNFDNNTVLITSNHKNRLDIDY